VVVLAGMSDAFRPLSHAQLRLWLLDRLEPGMASYNIVLRSTFVEIEGEPTTTRLVLGV
jgi:hypothetical protein